MGKKQTQVGSGVKSGGRSSEKQNQPKDIPRHQRESKPRHLHNKAKTFHEHWKSYGGANHPFPTINHPLLG